MSISSPYYEKLKQDVLGRLLDGSEQKIYVEAWNGVGATALLREVTEQIYQAMRNRKVLLVLCNIVNGMSIDPNDLGIPVGRWDLNAVLWTSSSNIDKGSELIIADLIVRIEPPGKEAAIFHVYKEAVEIARYIDESSGGSLRPTLQVVLRCFWYCLLLCRAFNRSVLLDDWPLEAVKYFVCDGILEGDAAWEIGKALATVIGPIIKYQLQYWENIFSAWMRTGPELLPGK